MQTKRVGIVIFDEVEVLDFCGPFEVFSVVRMDDSKRSDTASPFDVVLIGETDQPITTAGGMRVTPHHAFDHCPGLDVLLVPGGMGTRPQMNNPVMLDWLQARATEVEILTSVCTGSLLLARAGLLHGIRATTHWRALDLLRDSFPDVEVDADRHFVDSGRVVTSAGISAGIDMCLKLVERYCGERIARETARQMEYLFPEDDRRRIAL
jgi:transcriptional regulator GlxA family with amidase domain